MIRKLCIANRGEIAMRIIRTCKEMGIETVVVYSEADRDSMPVQSANESICIGDATPGSSYLNANAIIQVAVSTGCDAIHPGYGFLSENAHFARLVQACGLKFVGPSPSVIEQMGDKNKARQMIEKLGIRIIAGSPDVISDVRAGMQIAQELTYPVVIKASQGGGGKGMRIVWKEEEFQDSFEQAQKESESYFNSKELYIEKFLEHPKHVEVQLACDHFGHVVHLYDRDCSIQVHRQKQIEEAPCYKLSDEVRQRICQDAVKICQAVHYDSVGTVEFLIDKNGDAYFMEMNTRIQVEHPVTEMITGMDLIRLQLEIADDQPLSLEQKDICQSGHAIECRINAQDVYQDFTPSFGTISFLNFPGGRGIRVDSAAYSGDVISPYYDSLVCKLIAYGRTREECIQIMKRALEECFMEGIQTNEMFHYMAFNDRTFLDGSYDTAYAQQIMKELNGNEPI